MKQLFTAGPGNKRLEAVLSLFCAYFALTGAAQITQGAWAHRFLLIPLFGVMVLCSIGLMRVDDKRLKICSLVFGFLFALSYALGYQLNLSQTVGGFSRFLVICYTALCFTPTAAYGCIALCRLCLKAVSQPVSVKRPARQVFWFYTVIILLCWLPVFLAYYPGVFDYDAHASVWPALTGKYEANQPLLHTWIISSLYALGGRLGSYTTGIALYTLLQMLVISLTLSYGVTYLYKNGCSKVVRLLCLGFFALFPVCSMLSISVIKDALFAASILLLIICLHDAYHQPNHLHKFWYISRLILATALVCFSRNNGIAVIAIFLVLGFLLLRKNRALRLRFLVLFLCGILLFTGSTFAMVAGFQAESGPLVEALSVPLQQVSIAYTRHKAEIESADEIPIYIPAIDYYQPYIADYVKRFSNVGMGNLMEFAQIWWNLLLRYPADYIDAFLLVTQGNWYVDDLTNSQLYGVSLEGRTGYFMTNTKEGYGVEHTSYFPALEALYERLFSANEYQRIPLFAAFFCPALYAWFAWFLAFMAIYRRRKDILLGIALLIGLMMTLLLSPCALMRYMLPFVFACPILFGLLFCSHASPDACALSQKND